ncbi:hypothetical protein GCM10010168_42610 [Actinoplanes ianthinogenes]|uniref:Integral membrane protein n=1 Tax=Actinoplanes ianthinogenes TaxID=122358 RepID=A0ABM7LVT7_9ACTN|nr:hypothetical protein [Actinoplanes ianthinogenes]BCJ43429.1 hypothetical protein Aiant_40860 [Actinoplanes ianthinogenes]GGR20178.1 hypothetical protein GCM10010168_42610 [Actinoplanes ianthinogenes]
MPELELSYRRLLWAYPRFYRRERGLEILTTLMDAAEPGQTRPSRGEALHLLLIGLRYRFVPPGWISAVVAGFVTLWVALVCSGLGTVAVYAAQRPEPPRLAALADQLAGQPSATSTDASGYNPVELAYLAGTSGTLNDFSGQGWTGSRPVPDEQSRGYDGVPDVPGVLTAAYQRLQHDGWAMGEVVRDENSPDGVFWAERDGALITVGGTYEHSGITVHWYPVEPPGLLAGAIAGFVIGALLAWQALTWLAHRVARTGPGTRRRMLLISLPALVAAVVNSFDCVASMWPASSTTVLLRTYFMYPLGNQIANPLAPAIIALSLLGVIILVAEAKPDARLLPINQPTGEPAEG